MISAEQIHLARLYHDLIGQFLLEDCKRIDDLLLKSGKLMSEELAGMRDHAETDRIMI